MPFQRRHHAVLGLGASISDWNETSKMWGRQVQYDNKGEIDNLNKSELFTINRSVLLFQG